MKIISRKEAAALNISRFFTGIPCKYGHVCEKYVGNHRCVECQNKRNASRSASSGDRVAKKSAKKVYVPPCFDEVALLLRKKGARLIRGRCTSEDDSNG